MQLQQLVYQSKATVQLTPAQLEELLGPWRQYNHQQLISGLLLYGDDDIIQIIEGPAEAVHGLYNVIARDARHYDVITLADGPVAERAFAEWSMGFAALDAPRRQQLAGYVRPGQPQGSLPTSPAEWPELTAMLREFVAQQQQFPS